MKWHLNAFVCLLFLPAIALGATPTRVTQGALFQSTVSSPTARTVDCGTGILAGDVQVVHMEADGGSFFSTPSGWTKYDDTAPTPPVFESSYARIYASGATTFNFNWSTTTSLQGVCVVYRGVDTSNGLTTAIDLPQNATTSSQTILRVPAYTPAGDNEVILYFGSSRGSWTSVTSPPNFTHVTDGVAGGNAFTADEWRQTTATAIPQTDLTITGAFSSNTQWGFVIGVRGAVATVPNITSVSGDDIVLATETGLHILGTSLGASAGSIVCLDGAITSTWTVTNWTATDVTATAVQGNCRFGSTTLRLTTSTAQQATRPIVLNPVSGHQFMNASGQAVLAFSGAFNLQPNRFTYKGWGADPATDFCSSAVQLEAWTSGGSGSLTLRADLTATIPSTVTQITFRCHTGSVWATSNVWDIGSP